MASANIVLSQSSVSGTAGRSRDDLVTGVAVTLSNSNNSGAYSHRWVLLDRPTGSAATLTNSTSAVASFTPDVAGTYRIQLSVNEGNLAGQVQVRLAVVRDTQGLRFPAYGERDEESNWLISGFPNTRGWLPDLEAYLTAASSNNSVIYEANYASGADLAITGGVAHDLLGDGVEWTDQNAGELGTFDVRSGTGLRMLAATSNGGASTMTSASQAAAHVYLPLGSIPQYDPRLDLIVEVQISIPIFEANGEGFFVGLFGPANTPSSTSADRMRWAGLYNNAGTRALRTMVQATAVNTTDTRTTHDVVGFRLSAYGVGSAWSGVYADGFPTAIVGMPFSTLAGSSDPFNAAGVRLVMGLSTANDASPTTQVVVNRIRISQVR